jgi:hypothetical protein
MKKIITFLLLAMTCISSHGQSIIISTNLWSNIMAIEPSGQLFTEKIRFTTDTTIGSVTYKFVERTLDKNQLSWSRYGFIREDANKKVYYKLNASSPENLLYDMNLVMGDSVLAFGVNTFNFTAYMDSAMYHVTAVDSILIGTTYHKQLHLSGSMGGTFIEAAQWVDSMGGMSGILHNWNLKVGEDGYGLLCFEQNGILNYHNPNYTDCFVATGIDSHRSQEAIISLSPNPASDRIMITRKHSNSEGIITIYDGTGKTCYQEDHFTGDRINVSSFPPGIYVLRYSEGQTCSIKKFIVRR